MGLIPASYYLRRAVEAEDFSASLQFYMYFHKQMCNVTYFNMKAYQEAWLKYFEKFMAE